MSETSFWYSFDSMNSGIPGHKIIPNEGHKQKKCKQCQRSKRKTKSGWQVASRFRCEICNVSLCRDDSSKRGCFRQYHEELGLI